MTPLSVVIITFNEAANITRCIHSVRTFADEIVVVDSYSTDGTKSIAEDLGAKVILHAFEGYIEQKNYAITTAKFPFILSLDADEWLELPLIERITEIKKNPLADGYIFNRLNNYCGKWIKHGAWFPDKKLRLWDSRKGAWKGMNPHDEFVMEPTAKIQYVPLSILHQSYPTIDSHRQKIEKFAELAATAYLKNNKKSGVVNVWFNPCFRFIRDYIFKGGFLDGYFGLVIAWYSALEVHKKYIKLKELRRLNS